MEVSFEIHKIFLMYTWVSFDIHMQVLFDMDTYIGLFGHMYRFVLTKREGGGEGGERERERQRWWPNVMLLHVENYHFLQYTYVQVFFDRLPTSLLAYTHNR